MRTHRTPSHRTHTRGVTTTALVVLTALGVTAGLAAPAQARGDDVVRRGSCSGSTDWKLKAGPEDGRIEVEAEVDSNRSGQTWRWTLRHDGELSASGRATTRDPSGSFEVRRVVVDLEGSDDLVLRARHRASGEVCVGRVSI